MILLSGAVLVMAKMAPTSPSGGVFMDMLGWQLAPEMPAKASKEMAENFIVMVKFGRNFGIREGIMLEAYV